MTSSRTSTPGRQYSPAPGARSSRKRESWEIDFRLTREDATIEERREGFSHLKTLASRSASLDRRQDYYDNIVIPTDYSIVDLQIGVLDKLTNSGRKLAPFKDELVIYLNNGLRELSTVAERQREEGRGDQPRASVYGSDSPRQGSATELPSKDVTGAEKGLLEIFYLIEGIVSHHRDAFHGTQLAILLNTVTNITKTTTMRRALRGALKIFTAVSSHSRIPDTNLKSSVVTLCAILGNPSLNLGEEAGTCLFKLASSEDSQFVGDILLNQINNRSEISELRDRAKYRGSLLAIQRIAQNSQLISSITPSLTSLLSGLRRAYTFDESSALVTMKIVEALLLNDIIVKRFAREKWDFLRDVLDRRDDALTRTRDLTGITGLRVEVDPSSPLYGFINTDFASDQTLPDPELGPILGRIGERISLLLINEWRTLSKDQAMLTTRLLLQISRYAPIIWIHSIQAMKVQELLEPSDLDWSSHLEMLLTLVASSPSKPEPVVQSVLKVFIELHYSLMNDSDKSYECEYHFRSLCEALWINQVWDINIIKHLTEHAVKTTLDVDSDAFGELLCLIEQISVRICSGASSPTMVIETSPDSETLSECEARLFMRCFSRSCSRTVRLFKLLMDMATSSQSTRARLIAMSVLIRLRCHTDYSLRIVYIPASEDLSSNLCKKIAPGTTSEAAATPLTRPTTPGSIESSRNSRSRASGSGGQRTQSITRSVNAKDQWQPVDPPDWMQLGFLPMVSEAVPGGSGAVIYARTIDEEDGNTLDLQGWLELMMTILDHGSDWEIYSFVLVHLPLQLSNYSLFSNQVRLIQMIHSTIVAKLNNSDFLEPPKESGIKKGDVALCLYQILKMLLPYHEHFGRRMVEDTVRTFRMGIEKWDRTGKCCIHALALCCYEIPSHMEKHIVGITEMMQKRITQADLAMDVLEFLGCLSRLREAYGKADGAFYRRIFGICIRYLQVAWEQRQKHSEAEKSRSSGQYNRQSGSSGETVRHSGLVQSKESQGLSEYVYLLAYETIIVWFLSIDVRDRAQHVGWMTQELSWKDETGKDRMEEQSLVVLDMMHRTAFSNLGETEVGPDFVDPENKVIAKMWLVGMSIVTTEIASDETTGETQCGQLTKRQASGTTHATYYHNTSPLPAHHVQDDLDHSSGQTQQPLDVYPNHMFLQLTSTIAPTPLPLQPIPLPDDDFTRRALRVFDKIDTVDGHKVGVIYVGEGQNQESHILANTHGSDGYEAFLEGLGTKVPLKGAKFNTQGLDHRYDEDGTHTYAWRDRVTEVVFHVPTMMPTNLKDDPRSDKKKRHVGNDHVKIVYNARGQPYFFDTFGTALNTVNIVVTPEAHTKGAAKTKDKTDMPRKTEGTISEEPTKTERLGYYCVQTLFSQSYPQFSTAAGTQMISADALPAFVRQIAITCSVFCRVWEDSILRDSEYISGWRARLQEIIKLRKRYQNTNTSANKHYPMSGADQTVHYSEGSEWKGVATMGGMADADKLLNSLDFTRWT